jgi:hypothetical protein
MKDNGYLKILWLVGFIAFASVSCWATTESLHLLLASWPKIMCWIVTIGFFIIASIGTKLIVDSLNQNVFVQNPGLELIGGVILVLIFWLIFSMPTNTHTFFYRTTITDVVTQDLSTTEDYLQKLYANVKTENDIKAKQEEITRKVNTQFTAFINEIDNGANPGFDKRAKSILEDIANTLQSGEIPVLSVPSTISPKQMNLIKEQYRKMIYNLLEQRKAEISKNIRNSQESVYKPIAQKQIKNIETMKGVVANMGAQGKIDNNVITQADLTLKQAYTTIKNYKDFVYFQSNADKELYLAPNQVTKTSRMLSVIDVWKDFFAGKFSGRGFIFWIIISILVDSAAFIFFDLAFRKTDE